MQFKRARDMGGESGRRLQALSTITVLVTWCFIAEVHAGDEYLDSRCVQEDYKTSERTDTSGAGQREANSAQVLTQLWDRIRLVRGPMISAEPAADELEEYWRIVQQQCVAHLEAIVEDTSVPIDEVAEALLAKAILVDGADGMRWLAACEDIYIPRGGGGLHTPGTRWYELQLAGAEAEVKLLLADADARTVLFRIAAWRRMVLRIPTFVSLSAVTAQGMAEGHVTAEYWWHARNFVFLAIATSREDLLADADPARLDIVFKDWLAWIEANHYRLRASSAGPLWTIDERREALGSARSKKELESISEIPDLMSFPELPFSRWRGPLPLTPERHPRTS